MEGRSSTAKNEKESGLSALLSKANREIGLSQYAWVKSRELEGSLEDPSIGCWGITVKRVMRGWGQIEKGKFWNDYPHSWPPPSTAPYDADAKLLRTNLYTLIWDSLDCLHAFRRGSGVGASFRVTAGWEWPPQGIIDFDSSKNQVLGGHSVSILPPAFFTPVPLSWTGDSFFVFPNSWGSEWGNRGWGAMTHQCFDREMYEAFAIDTEVEFPPVDGSGVQHIQWKPEEHAYRHVYVNEVLDVDNDDRLAWAIAVHRRGELHVEDLYVKPYARGRGYGSQLLDAVLKLANRVGQPVRFWIHFADVEDSEDRRLLQRLFASRGLRIEKSPRNWAAYCAVPGEPADQLPEIALPPKPAYTFVKRSACAVDWEGLQETYDTSAEFIDAAKDVFQSHEELLRRLA